MLLGKLYEVKWLVALDRFMIMFLFDVLKDKNSYLSLSVL